MCAKSSVWLLAVLGVLLAASCAWADTLRTKDGRVFEGRVQQDGSGSIVFETTTHGVSATLTFRRDEVAELTRGPLADKPVAATQAAATKPAKPAKTKASTAPAESRPAGPTCYIVPIQGKIGRDVSAAQIRECLTEARKLKATVVLLEVHSGGGAVDETEQILRLLESAKDLRIVAHIRDAGSAAAIITLSCKEIYVHPQAIIGSALAIQHTPWGTVEVEEKMQSFWRARCRTAAEHGGHEPLLAEAMVDSSVELCIEQVDGKPVVKRGATGRVLKATGKLLALTAKEAIDCGLARGEVINRSELGATLGYPKWTALTQGEARFKAHRAKIDHAEKTLRDLSKRFDGLNDDIKRATTPQEGSEAIWGMICILQQVKKIAQEQPLLRIDVADVDEAITKLSTSYKKLKAEIAK